VGLGEPSAPEVPNNMIKYKPRSKGGSQALATSLVRNRNYDYS